MANMTNREKEREINGIALNLAPSLRDKFDFSTEDQHAKWAELTIKAAMAFHENFSSRMLVAAKRDAEDQAKAEAAKQAEQQKAALQHAPEQKGDDDEVTP